MNKRKPEHEAQDISSELLKVKQVQTLFVAIKQGNVKVVQALFSRGVDVNATDQYGQTALFVAAKQGNLAVVQALLSRGVDVNATDQHGQTALFAAAKQGNGEVVQTLLSHGVDVNATDQDGQTALFAPMASGEFKIVKQLLEHGANASVVDNAGSTAVLHNTYLVNRLPDDIFKLMELLLMQGAFPSTKNVKPWLSWSSKSKRHQELLTEVAQGQNASQTGSFHYHTKPIGSGTFTFVYAGLNSMNGMEVAIKRIEKMRICRPEDSREIKSLVQLKDSEHVVRYLSYREDQDFLYIVLELMEGTLEELMDMGEQVKEEEISLCKDILDGLKFLHYNKVIHRDIKPGNVLFISSPKLSLKLADFGLSGRIASSGGHTTTVMHSKAGTRCWMAPELVRGTAKHSEASDMFACGLVLHYFLSVKKHPFRPEDEAGKSVYFVQNETEANILNNKVMIDKDISHEAQDLAEIMVDQNKDHRPSAAEALRHPLFWSNQKKLYFLIAVGNQPEIECPQHHVCLSTVERDLEKSLGPQFATNPWNEDIPELYDQMRNFQSYETNSVVDLLRLVRNTHAHFPDLYATMKTEVLEENVFCTKFPTLLMCVYKSVRKHGWEHRTDIASAM